MALIVGLFPCFAGDATQTQEAMVFVRHVVESLLDAEKPIRFAIADKVFAMDNGETVSRDDLQKAWPDFAHMAFKKRVSAEQFFRDVEVQFSSPRDNKRLMSNARLLGVYTPQDGDLYCDASHVKEGVENFIGYEKAFIYIIRKTEGQWVLIGIGG